jgi:hypothetical protein
MRVRVDLANDFHGRDIGLAQSQAQLLPQLVGFAEGRCPAPLAAHEGKEGDLVDGGEEMRSTNPGRHVFGGSSGIGREPVGEFRRERIEIIGIAVMAQVPDRQNLVAVHGRDEWIKTGEVVSAALVHEGPGNALAGDRDAQRAQEGIILLHMLPVLRLRDEIPPALVFPDKGGALEA